MIYSMLCKFCWVNLVWVSILTTNGLVLCNMVLCDIFGLRYVCFFFFFFFSSRRRHTRSKRDWSSDVCSSDLTATDNCGTPILTSSDGVVSSNGCDRTQIRTWTAADACGNSSTESRTVSWTYDVTPPTITSTGTTTTLGCNPTAENIDAALGSATATDNCGTPALTSSDGTVASNGCDRTQTRTWTATDACGNTSTASRTVSWTYDVTPPTITATGTTTTLGCNPTAANIDAALGSATATDNCGTPALTSSDGIVASNGCDRTQTRTWTATDGCGNTSTESRTVSWTFDITAPVITATGTTTTLGCNPTAADIDAALGSATATDNCGTPILTSSDGTVASNGCDRSETRTWTATDACGNTSTASRTVSWTYDVTAPTITATGTTTTLGCNPTAADIDGALGSATATDNCGTPALTSIDNTVSSSGCDNTETRTWTATDACGNSSTALRTERKSVENER